MSFIKGLVYGSLLFGNDSSKTMTIKEYRKKFYMEVFPKIKIEITTIKQVLDMVELHNQTVRQSSKIILEYNQLLKEKTLFDNNEILKMSLRQREFAEKQKYIIKVRASIFLFVKQIKYCMALNSHTNKWQRIDMESIYHFYFWKNYYTKKYMELIQSEIDLSKEQMYEPPKIYEKLN